MERPLTCQFGTRKPGPVSARAGLRKAGNKAEANPPLLAPRRPVVKMHRGVRSMVETPSFHSVTLIGKREADCLALRITEAYRPSVLGVG